MILSGRINTESDALLGHTEITDTVEDESESEISEHESNMTDDINKMFNIGGESSGNGTGSGSGGSKGKILENSDDTPP